MSKLTEQLIAHGAPVLKGIIETAIGGVGGRLAGAVIDELAGKLGVPATEEAVADAIAKEPERAGAIVEQVETDTARIAEAARDQMISYHQVIMQDAKAEGWLASRWRPLFAVVFSICFLMVCVTMCRAVWLGHVEALTALAALTGFLIFLFTTGAGVLGVYVWKRSDEKIAS
jgi:hypothetical protein